MEYQFLRNFRPRRNQRGQATLEYLLLLFVIVALFTGVLMKFGVAFRTYGDVLVGGQLKCALEYGKFPDELPSGICDPEFNMGPLGNNGGGGDGTGGTSGSGSENGENGTGKDPNASGSESSASSGGSGGGSGADGGSQGYGSGRGGRRFASSNGNRKDTDGKNGSEDTADDQGISRGSRKVTVINETVRVGDSRNSRYIPIVGSAGKETTATSTGAISVKSDSEEIKVSKKIPVDMTDRKPTALPPDEPMSFAKFLRYLIIAAIVVALFVFFGSQIMNFQKSKD